MPITSSFVIKLGQLGSSVEDCIIDPLRLAVAKAIIDGLQAVLTGFVHIPQVKIKHTDLILDVEADTSKHELSSIEIHILVLEIIECITVAAATLRQNAAQPKPSPLKKLRNVADSTMRLLRALKDGARVRIQVQYIHNEETVLLPMPQASDFTDVIQSHTETRQLDQLVCGHFSDGDKHDHMLVLRDRTFVKVPLELEEILEMVRQKKTFAGVVSRKSAQEDWNVADEYRVPGELFPTHT